MFHEMLIRCAAPTLAGMKTGSLFTAPFEIREQMTRELRTLNRSLCPKGLRLVPLRWRAGKALLYLYRPARLARDLRDPLAIRLLRECGYPGTDVDRALAHLIQRLGIQQDFPHEIGLFLGYPPADVDGFMHRRAHCKGCGLWKVYDDLDGALRQFERCRRCTAAYLRRYAAGWTVDALAIAG